MKTSIVAVALVLAMAAPASPQGVLTTGARKTAQAAADDVARLARTIWQSTSGSRSAKLKELRTGIAKSVVLLDPSARSSVPTAKETDALAVLTSRLEASVDVAKNVIDLAGLEVADISWVKCKGTLRSTLTLQSTLLDRGKTFDICYVRERAEAIPLTLQRLGY